jgi:hypothetical protein
MLDNAQKLSNFLLEIMTLVTLVSIMGSEIFIVEWRAFIYIMKRKGPRIDP